MSSRSHLLRLGLFAFAMVVPGLLLAEERSGPRLKVGEYNPDHETVEMFDAIADGTIAVEFIALDDTAANVLIKNKSKKPVNVQLPDSFAGVPVAAQFGGGGAGGFGGGGGGQGLGGGFGGGGGGGGGLGQFNVAPEKVGKVQVNCLCLDHGKPDPNPRMKYEIKPIDSYVDNQETIELVKMFATGKVARSAAQAAVWHANNDVSWQELAAKRSGEKRLIGPEAPYFAPSELRLAVQLFELAKNKAAQSEVDAALEAEFQ